MQNTKPLHKTRTARILRKKSLVNNATAQQSVVLSQSGASGQRVHRKKTVNIIAALVQSSSESEEVTMRVDAIREHSSSPLATPRKQPIMIHFLYGVVLHVITCYCPPKPRGANDDPLPEERRGLSPELAAYGFGKKCSPALEEEVSRAAAFYPSFEVAQRELALRGRKMNVKEIRRISMQCGEGLLVLRRQMVESFFDNTLVCDKSLAGKNVVVELDGGRIRHRENKAQTQSQAAHGKHPKYHAPWREPKLLVIDTVDENGKKEKNSRVGIDATLQGADHSAQLLCAHLKRLGIVDAKSVTFIADGAPWIWERFDGIVQTLDLPRENVSFVLDFYHASHPISLALTEIMDDENERKAIDRELRSELRQSRWKTVVERLEQLGGNLASKEDSVFCRELRYLRRHGKSGHLSYVRFSRRGLPLGSGAVESSIRRVINLRMKSNGMFRAEENAEKMLQLRCQIMSTEWDAMLDALYRKRCNDRNQQWRWNAAPCETSS